MKNNEPAYLKIYKKLKDDILKGIYPVDSFLPSENELCTIFQYSKITIRRAISILVQENYVQVRQGRGTRVLKNTDINTYLKFHNITSVTEVFEGTSGAQRFSVHGMYINQIPASAKIAKKLEIQPNTTIYRMQRIFGLNDEPFSFMVNYLRMDFFPELENHIDEFINLYLFLQKQYGVSFSSGDEYITATTADLIDAQILGIKVGSSLLFSERIARCNLGIFEVVENKLRTDHFKIKISMNGAPDSNTFER